MKGDLIIFPASTRKDILEAINVGRQGAEKCKLRARTCVYWPLMNSGIYEVTHECPDVQEITASEESHTA